VAVTRDFLDVEGCHSRFILLLLEQGRTGRGPYNDMFPRRGIAFVDLIEEMALLIGVQVTLVQDKWPFATAQSSRPSGR